MQRRPAGGTKRAPGARRWSRLRRLGQAGSNDLKTLEQQLSVERPRRTKRTPGEPTTFDIRENSEAAAAPLSVPAGGPRGLRSSEASRLAAFKNVTYNEPFFPGHFPGLADHARRDHAGSRGPGLRPAGGHDKSGVRADSGLILYFAGIDEARFKRPVVPGDQLMLPRRACSSRSATCGSSRRGAWSTIELACEAEMICVLKEPPAGLTGALIRAFTAVDRSEAPRMAREREVGLYQHHRRRCRDRRRLRRSARTWYCEGPMTIGRDNRIFQFSLARRDLAGQDRQAGRCDQGGDRRRQRPSAST